MELDRRPLRVYFSKCPARLKDGIDAFRTFFEETDLAFRRRRSIQLLNYESQVKFTQLPWASMMEEERVRRIEIESEKETREDEKELFISLVRACITKWPHVIIPNKMVSALDTVARSAELEKVNREYGDT